MIDEFTTIPDNIITPMNAGIDIGLPVSGNPINEPSNPTGSINIIITGIINDSNCAANIKYTNPKATASAYASLVNDS